MNPQADRGRVVMLVDNGVHGDSRVQKAARSAAEAGWQVTLLGRSPDSREHIWQLGGAEVRLIPMPEPLSRRRHEFRRRWRVPLAYPPNGIAEHRTQWVKAWQADLRLRQAQGQPAKAAWAASEALRLWVYFRRGQLRWANRSRNRLTEPWDRAYTWFWSKVMGERAWRRLEPGLWDYELAYGPVVDALQPDLIHANDFRMLGVGARAKIRASAAGRAIKLVWDAHEFLPGVKPWRDNARWLPAHVLHEREYARHADAVMTVSPALAELLATTHGLKERPSVVLNAPLPGAAAHTDVRTACGLGPGTPLLVYSGVAADKRGLDAMIDALPELPDVHVALVVNRPESPYVRGLTAKAAKLGVVQRVHVLPYVPADEVAGFLSTADIGVIPILHYPNHEIALITKFFEYSHARLPLVVSDVKTMAATVRQSGQGEVFPAGDADGFRIAIGKVLADPGAYRAAYDKPGLLDEWTWPAQAAVLDEVYRRVLEGSQCPT
jgi:glycogen synthase